MDESHSIETPIYIYIYIYIYIFFFFFISKYYKKETSKEYTGSGQKEAKHTEDTKENQKNYLHPNHVRKSKTKFVVSLPNRLAQLHKLETKLILILWVEVTLFSNASLFLAHHRVQNKHMGAAIQRMEKKGE